MHYRQYRAYPLVLHYESVRQVTLRGTPRESPDRGHSTALAMEGLSARGF